ncbi:MAG TPA: hypothetical protein VFE10_04450 [Phenylobacterium sp.]|jgi:hypothetical protein|nr:hypothetical protein [Phenylobacterium sp.]
MPDLTCYFRRERQGHRSVALRFTPAEWHVLIEDGSFLTQPDNRYSPPRRLMGVPVEIVPDHRFG